MGTLGLLHVFTVPQFVLLYFSDKSPTRSILLTFQLSIKGALHLPQCVLLTTP